MGVFLFELFDLSLWGKQAGCEQHVMRNQSLQSPVSKKWKLANGLVTEVANRSPASLNSCDDSSPS